ncbi:MAG: fibronectin type III domain-containing protein, partial [Gemmatimonadetes bacterium]
MTTMSRRWWVALGAAGLLAACSDSTTVFVPDGDEPAPPVGVEASYFNRAVRVTWELSPQWRGETFRVWSRRVGAGDFLLIAEVTSCADGFCEYTDTNIQPNTSYEYFVSAFDPDTGLETDSFEQPVVDVPSFDAPPAPNGLEVIALDNANFLRWADNARAVSDFANYRVYLIDPGSGQRVLLGETDSEGFLDLVAVNGVTVTYVVSSVDVWGHESEVGAQASGTPRPDFTGELLFAFEDVPGQSGFRFRESDAADPVVSGTSPLRHFRLEADAFGWWIVPGPGAAVFPEGRFTTALKCGPAADEGCVDWTVAPTSGYTTADLRVDQEFTYMLRVPGDDGELHYGAIRVSILGTDQSGNAIMIFDWAYQLQPGNPNLAPAGG